MTIVRHPAPHRDRGTMSLEFAIAAPLFVALFMFLAAMGRIVDGKSQVDGAARDAVRAASIARSRGGAQDLAQQAAKDSLAGVGWCKGGPVAVLASGTDWRPGGQVRVTVTCDVDLGDLTFIGMPGHKVMTAHATAPIDQYTYRGGGR